MTDIPRPGVSTMVEQSQHRLPFCKAHLKLLILACLVVVAVIVIAVVLSKRQDKPIIDDPDPPVALDFSTGASLVTYYAVDAKIRNRLASTKFTIEVTNGLNCSSIHAISLNCLSCLM